MPIGSLMPALLVDQVVLRDGVQQLVVPAEADVARHVVHPGHVAGADLVAGDRHHAVGAPARHVLAGDAAVDRADLDARPCAGRPSSPCRWRGWSPRCRGPRRGGCPWLRSTPRPEDLDPGVARRRRSLRRSRATTLVEPRSSAATSRCGCALTRRTQRTMTWPANRPSSSANCRPCRARSCATAVTARMSSAVSCGPNQSRRPSTSKHHVRTHPPRGVDPGEQRRIVVLQLAPAHRATIAPPPISTGRSGAEASGSNGSTLPPSIHQRQPIALRRERHRHGLLQLGSRSVPGQPAAHLARRRTPGSARTRRASASGSSKTLALGRDSRGRDHLRRIKILQSRAISTRRTRKNSSLPQDRRRPEPERPRRPRLRQAAVQPRLQAALSHRTSSGATRVMSPAPSVSTTSPGRSDSYTWRPTSARAASNRDVGSGLAPRRPPPAGR